MIKYRKEYYVNEDYITEFEQAYGKDGEFGEMFVLSGCKRYILLKQKNEPHKYLIINIWDDEATFGRAQEMAAQKSFNFQNRSRGWVNSVNFLETTEVATMHEVSEDQYEVLSDTIYRESLKDRINKLWDKAHGKSLRSVEECKEAIAIYTELLQIMEQDNCGYSVCAVLHNRALYYGASGDFEASLKDLNNELEIAQKENDLRRIPECKNIIEITKEKIARTTSPSFICCDCNRSVIPVDKNRIDKRLKVDPFGKLYGAVCKSCNEIMCEFCADMAAYRQKIKGLACPKCNSLDIVELQNNLVEEGLDNKIMTSSFAETEALKLDPSLKSSENESESLICEKQKPRRARKVSLQNIEVEAETLEEANKQLSTQLASGLEIVYEKVEDSQPDFVVGTGDSIEDAFMQAQQRIPDGCTIIKKEELIQSSLRMVKIEAFEEEEAKLRAGKYLGKEMVLQSLQLIMTGRKGVLGLGKTPNQYEAGLFQKAVTKITYKKKVNISAVALSPEDISLIYEESDQLKKDKKIEEAANIEFLDGIKRQVIKAGGNEFTYLNIFSKAVGEGKFDKAVLKIVEIRLADKYSLSCEQIRKILRLGKQIIEKSV